MEKTIDCRGMACPLPVVNAKNAAMSFTEDGTLTVLVDNEIAVQNLGKFAKKKGFASESETKGEHDFAVTMQVKADANAAELTQVQPSQQAAAAPSGGKTVLVGANTMGTGDEKLGKNLMKTFLFALASQDEVPANIIFFNTGAYLTCEGSESVQDLKGLEGAGAQITTCGTCLDYYGLKEKLQVGSVSNMYDIVETLMASAVVIRP